MTRTRIVANISMIQFVSFQESVKGGFNYLVPEWNSYYTISEKSHTGMKAVQYGKSDAVPKNKPESQHNL